jgi:hypothetical protein
LKLYSVPESLLLLAMLLNSGNYVPELFTIAYLYNDCRRQEKGTVRRLERVYSILLCTQVSQQRSLRVIKLSCGWFINDISAKHNIY